MRRRRDIDQAQPEILSKVPQERLVRDVRQRLSNFVQELRDGAPD